MSLVDSNHVFAVRLLDLGGWVPSEQIGRQVQEVEKVREAHKAAAKCTNGSNCGNGTKCTNLEEVQKLEISCPPPPFFFREAHAPF